MTREIKHIKNNITSGDRFNVLESNYKTIFSIITLRHLSSDALLGILLVSAGVIGSMMSTLRSGYGRYLKTIILGGSVGFISLLAVRGGATVFLLENAGKTVPLNAYSTALASIVAGLFSEKFYFAISHLTDQALEKFTGNSVDYSHFTDHAVEGSTDNSDFKGNDELVSVDDSNEKLTERPVSEPAKAGM